MPAALRYLLFALAGLLVLGAVAIGGILLLLDPNDYKPHIEKAAETHTRLDLQLDGDIGWSFIPLGLELNKVSASLDDAPFVELDKLVARVSLRSLIAMQPAVHRFELAGLELNLVKAEDGSGNWERVMPEGSGQAATEKAAEEKAPTESSDSGELQFNVSEVAISDMRLHYHDKVTGQKVTLDDFALNASNIKPGAAFPLDLQFHLATTEPTLDINTQLSTRLTLGEAFQQFLLQELNGTIKLQGEPTNNQPVELALSGKVDASLADSRIQLAPLNVSVNQMQLSTQLDVKQFDTTPQLSGNLNIAEFSARKLLTQLGISLPPMQDSTTLEKVALDATLGGKPGQITIKPLTLQLDSSKLSGEVRYTLDSGALFSRLNLNALNADRYLPPQTETTAEAESTPEAPTAAETDLLPLETLRGLNLDIGLTAGELIANQIAIKQLKLQATAAKGMIKISPLSGQLYEGAFNANATIDGSSDNPRWQVQANVSDVKTLPLLTQLAEMQQFSGRANINLDLNTRGNRVSVLRNNAKGKADFAIAEGRLEGTSMSAYACQGIALMNKETIDTSAWPKVTDFENLSGAITINGNSIKNQALTAQLKGMALEGEGDVNIDSMELDYRAGLRILGNVHGDPACRVNEKLKNLIIPVKCEGALAGEEGLPCKFDTVRFRETVKDMAKAEAKQKANEEIDRGKEKLKEKAAEKFQKLFGR
ncbi:AsmA protein [Litorivivens lipolytica]|uniref:AsmA protein n=1 Tax=Litorivivens lipolytica TaxID=1524264 RepID=A0A7W4W5U5_9GAMM|nr:AsmA family protein [Litorivivens lipolytica]MBB3047414.1 AsmA protein [Litorivivens lipolytica]